MSSKEPVLLTVVIQTDALRWYVAGVGLEGTVLPLICSAPGNLAPYLGAALDDQVSFLRHRLAGVLQRGCDRLWGLQKKPCQIVFLADGPFAQAPPELTPHVAEHFVQWMVNPPVAFFLFNANSAADARPTLERVAGEMTPDRLHALNAGLPALLAAIRQADVWEIAPGKAGA